MIAVTPAAPVASQATMEHGECDQRQVGLGLAAAGREPEQLDDRSVRVRAIDDRRQRKQDEGELEGAPPISPTVSRRGSAPQRRPIHLVGHRTVGELEGTQSVRVAPHHLDSGRDPLARLLAGFEVLGSRPSVPLQLQSRRVQVALCYPARVAAKEGVSEATRSGAEAAARSSKPRRS